MPGEKKNANNANNATKVEGGRPSTLLEDLGAKPDQLDRKICPLMSSWHRGTRIKVLCGSDCAWWDWIRGRCAIQSVSMIAPTTMRTDETISESTAKLGRILMQMDSTIRDASQNLNTLARRLNDVVDMTLGFLDQLEQKKAEGKAEAEAEVEGGADE